MTIYIQFGVIGRLQLAILELALSPLSLNLDLWSQQQGDTTPNLFEQ